MKSLDMGGGSPSSIAMYKAVLRRPSRGWLIVAGLLALAMLCGSLMYTATAARDAYFASTCARVGDTWTGRECKPREETPPPAQHFTLELPPIPAEPDDERKPAPAPSGPQL